MEQRRDRTTIDRRRLFELAGTGMVATGVSGLGSAAERREGSAPSSSETVEYTLTVIAPDGSVVGETTVEDEFDPTSMGERVRVRGKGDSLRDGDIALVDGIRSERAGVIENWVDRTLSEYEQTGTSRDGHDYEVIEDDRAASGESVLRVGVGQNWVPYLSKTQLYEPTRGDVVTGKLRHETDNSSSYAMVSEFAVGFDEEENGGIGAGLANPGSQRTAGAYLKTPNERVPIEFDPTLEAYYTFRIAIGGTPLRIEQSPGAPAVDEEVTFRAKDETGDFEQFEWSLGDSTEATGQVVTHAYTEPGEYGVTLTATNADGTTTDRTATVAVGEEDQRGDGGVTAAFEYSPEVVAPGEQITFDASDSESQFSGIDLYEWTFGAETESPEYGEGRQTTYAFDEPGEYAVQLGVTDTRGSGVAPNAPEPPVTDRATATVLVEGNDQFTGFTVDETNPTVLDDVRFRAEAADAGPPGVPPTEPGEEYEWDFKDGTTATGLEVVHQFDNFGTYEVELTDPAGRVFSQEITVDPAPIEITDVDRGIGGELLAKLPVEEEIEVTVEADPGVTIESVRFDLVGRGQSEEVDGYGDGSYSASFSMEESTPTNELVRVRAIGSTDDTENIIHREEVEIPIIAPPDWIEFLLETAGDLFLDVSDSRIQFGYNPFENLNIAFDFPGETFEKEQPDESVVDLSAEAGADFYPWEVRADFYGGGGIDADLIDVAFAANILACGTVDSNLQLRNPRADVDASVSVDIPSAGPFPLSIPIPGSNKTIGIEPTVSGLFAGSFEFEDDLAFDQGTVTPGAGLEIDFTVGIEDPTGWAEVDFYIGVGGTLQVQADIGTNDRDLGGRFEFSGELVVDVMVGDLRIEGDPIRRESLKGGIDDPDSGVCDNIVDQSSDDIVDLEKNVTGDGTTVFEAPNLGGEHPLPSIPSVDEPTAVSTAQQTTIAPSTAEVGAVDRITKRDYEDTQPSVAVIGPDEYLVVWSQQSEEKSADAGRDIVARRYVEGTWETPVQITDGTTGDIRPRTAVTDDGRIIAVWTTFTLDATESDFDDPVTLLESGEVFYSVFDGDTWSDPVRITDTDTRQQRPAVDTDGDDWILAWQSIAPETDETAVQVARVDDSGVTRLAERTGSASPSVSARPDGTVDVAYVSVGDEGPTGVVRQTLEADGSISDEQVYDDTGAKRVVISDGRLLWSSRDGGETTVREGVSGSIEPLPIREDISEIRELDLASIDGQTLATYRGKVTNSPNRDLVYRLDTGDGWVRDREIAGGPAREEDIWWSETEFVDEETFLTTYAVGDPGDGGVNDVFVTTHEFAPDYALGSETSGSTLAQSPSVEPAPAGEETTVSYTVDNLGDVDGSETITVAIDAAETTTVQHGPLSVNDPVTNSETVTVPEDGRITITIDSSEPTLGTERTRAELIAATSALRTGTITATRTARDEATVTIAVRNDGGAVAEDIAVAVQDGTAELARQTVDRIDPESTGTIETTVDPTALGTDAQTIDLDPESDHPDRAFAERTRQAHLIKPDLSIDDLRYRRDGDTAFVEATISNGGPGVGNGTYRVAGEDELASTPISIPPAINGVPRSGTVRLELPELSTGRTLSHRIEPSTASQSTDGLARNEEVATVLPGTYFTAGRYTTEDGRVETEQLRDAVGDWQSGRIDLDLLRRLIDAWRANDRVF